MKLSFPLVGKSFSELPENDRRFFVGDEYLPLPKNHASQIILLDKPSAQRVKDFAKSELGFSNMILGSSICFPYENHILLHDKWNAESGLQEVRQWLYNLRIPFNRGVFLLYYPQVILIPWKLVVRYWDAFAWSVGVAMHSFDDTGSWVCEFHHEEVISFSAHKPLKSVT